MNQKDYSGHVIVCTDREVSALDAIRLSGRRMPKGPRMTPYEEKIVKAFRDVCERNKYKKDSGASPAEVYHLLCDRKEIAAMDTVLDVEKLMRGLRNRGFL